MSRTISYPDRILQSPGTHNQLTHLHQQTNDNAETYREVITFGPGSDFPSGNEDDSTWSQGRAGEVRATYLSMQSIDPLDNEEEEEQTEVEEEEHQHQQQEEEQQEVEVEGEQEQTEVEEEERPGSYSHLLGDYPAAPRRRLGFNFRMPVPRLRLRRPTLPAMTLPPMRFPRPWAKVPAVPVARRSSLAEGPLMVRTAPCVCVHIYMI